SFSTPSPRWPRSCTRGRSQTSTSMRPLMFSISNLPSGSRRYSWLMGVFAKAPRATSNRPLPRIAARAALHGVGFMQVSGSAECGAPGEGQALFVGPMELLQQQSGSGIAGQGLLDDFQIAVQLLVGRL